MSLSLNEYNTQSPFSHVRTRPGQTISNIKPLRIRKENHIHTKLQKLREQVNVPIYTYIYKSLIYTVILTTNKSVAAAASALTLFFFAVYTVARIISIECEFESYIYAFAYMYTRETYVQRSNLKRLNFQRFI